MSRRSLVEIAAFAAALSIIGVLAALAFVKPAKTAGPRPMTAGDAGLLAGAYLREHLELAGQTLARVNLSAISPAAGADDRVLIVAAELDTGERLLYLVGERYGWNVAGTRRCGNTVAACARLVERLNR